MYRFLLREYPFHTFVYVNKSIYFNPSSSLCDILGSKSPLTEKKTKLLAELESVVKKKQHGKVDFTVGSISIQGFLIEECLVGEILIDKEEIEYLRSAFLKELPRKRKDRVSSAFTRLEYAVMGFENDDYDSFIPLKSEIEVLNFNKDKLELLEYVRALMHDLQTPLTSLRSEVEILDNTNLENQLGFLRNYLETISGLLNQEIVYDSNQFIKKNVGGFIKEISRKFEASANQKGLKIQVAYCDQKVSIIPQRFELAINNLFSNAIKYSYNNNNLKNSSAGINVKFQTSDRSIKITFENKGELISHEHIESGEIFKISKRYNLSRNTKGMGLGLNFVKNIIEKEHKGLLTIKSELITERSDNMALTKISFSIPLT